MTVEDPSNKQIRNDENIKILEEMIKNGAKSKRKNDKAPKYLIRSTFINRATDRDIHNLIWQAKN